MKSVWINFFITRAIGLIADGALALIACICAVLLRFDFSAPRWGWRITAMSFATVILVQLVSLIATGCYRLPWRRTCIGDIPRYVSAFGLCGFILCLMRYITPEDTFAHVRPPYTVIIISTILSFCLAFGIRLLWRRYFKSTKSDAFLLRRDVNNLAGERVVGFIRGKTVLVTGAGGTIGSEIVRQIVCNGAACVVMVERCENALYEIDREMRESGVTAKCIPEMADISDELRMRKVLDETNPDIVLHAAAYKHVPMVEANPLDGLRNNSIATCKFGKLCASAGVKSFVMISTDKAVRPISIMGMTKRLAEVLLLRLNNQNGGTVFSCVRFGNVLGSSGSVVPLFREQIANRKPLTVTHPDMQRYFMSVEEAVGLVLEASVMGNGCIYTLDMGKPVRIVELAENMIRQAGYKPYIDVPILFTGIRPGEKLSEDLDVSDKSVYKTGHSRIFINKVAGRGDDVTFDEVEFLAASNPSDDEVKHFLRTRVGSFETAAR